MEWLIDLRTGHQGDKDHDGLFKSQLMMSASRDKQTIGVHSEAGELVWKPKGVESKKALFRRELRAKGLEDNSLSSAYMKSFCVGAWHFDPASPNGTSIQLMSTPALGVDKEDV